MKRAIFNISLIIIGFITSYFLDNILYSFCKDWSSYLPDNAFLWHATWFTLQLLPVAIITLILFKKSTFNLLGLNSRFLKPFLFALIFTAPLFIGLAIVGKFNTEITITNAFSNCIYPGFYEEILVRSFLIGILFRHFKWGFIPASLLGALFFGAWHIYQGHDVLSSLMAFAVTALGSIWFGWLYIEWRFNAWINISLHALMNFSWLLFQVEGGAAGTIWSNIFRIITIVLSIIFTIHIQSKKNGFIINRKNLWINK